jgi:protein-tyrosine phosphatase
MYHPEEENLWRGRLTHVGEDVWVSGELLGGEKKQCDTLSIEAILDVTDHGKTWEDDNRHVIWAPSHDDGNARDPRWMRLVGEAGEDPGRLLVHCHMGVNRAPSAAILVLMRRGMTETEAIESVMTHRRVADAIYVPDIVSWELQYQGVSAEEAQRRSSAAEVLRQQLALTNRRSLLGY